LEHSGGETLWKTLMTDEEMDVLESYLEVVVFRAAQEMLGNAMRHSQGSEIKIQLEMPEHAVKLSIEDNGKGFDPHIIEDVKKMGLRLIKERVEILKGQFDIDSTPGRGARVFITVPILSPASHT